MPLRAGSDPRSTAITTGLALTIAFITAVLLAGVAWLLARQGATASSGSGVLPTLNATLNGATTVCLISGWRAIRRRDVARHRVWMLTSVVLSTLFLAFYVIHHYRVGSVRFVGPSWLRMLYLAVLLPHVVLSAAIVPLVLLTVTRALLADFDGHRRVARWTLPLWLIVSVTGVLVYWMLYHWSRSFL